MIPGIRRVPIVSDATTLRVLTGENRAHSMKTDLTRPGLVSNHLPVDASKAGTHGPADIGCGAVSPRKAHRAWNVTTHGSQLLPR